MERLSARSFEFLPRAICASFRPRMITDERDCLRCASATSLYHSKFVLRHSDFATGGAGAVQLPTGFDLNLIVGMADVAPCFTTHPAVSRRESRRWAVARDTPQNRVASRGEISPQRRTSLRNSKSSDWIAAHFPDSAIGTGSGFAPARGSCRESSLAAFPECRQGSQPC